MILTYLKNYRRSSTNDLDVATANVGLSGSTPEQADKWSCSSASPTDTATSVTGPPDLSDYVGIGKYSLNVRVVP
jgi:hypothetical protein